MKFEFIGDPLLQSKIENASNERQLKAAEDQFYQERPYVEMYGYKFKKGAAVNVDETKTVSDRFDSGLVVDKLKNNSHFKLVEEREVNKQFVKKETKKNTE